MASDVDDLVARLRTAISVLVGEAVPSPERLKAAVDDLSTAADLLIKFQAIFRSIQGTGPFICGYSGEEQGPGKPLPERIHVCAALGSDYVEIYRKVG
jgi:hypothetical protein